MAQIVAYDRNGRPIYDNEDQDEIVAYDRNGRPLRPSDVAATSATRKPPPSLAEDAVNAVRSANNFALFGGADEYEGAVNTAGELLSGKIGFNDVLSAFERNRAASDAARADFDARRPLAAIAAKTAGGIVTLPGTIQRAANAERIAQAFVEPTTREIVNMTQRARPLVESAKTGLVGGAFGGYLSSDPNYRAEGAVFGGAIGTAVSPAVTAGVALAGVSPKTAIEKARQIVRKAFEEDGALKQKPQKKTKEIRPAIQHTANALQNQGGPVEETISEIAGPTTQGLARAVANVPGPGQAVAEDVLIGRRDGNPTTENTPWWGGKPERRSSMSERVVEAANDSADNPPDWGTLVVNMATVGKEKQTARYEKTLADAEKVVVAEDDLTGIGKEIDKFLNDVTDGPGILPDDPSLTGLQRARRVVREQLERLAATGNFTLRGIERIRQQINRIYRAASKDGYDGPAVGDVIDQIDKRLEKIADARSEAGDPTFRLELDNIKATRKEYGTKKQMEEAIEQGRRVLKDDAADIYLWMYNDGQGRNQSEADGYMAGVVKAVEDAVNRNDAAAIGRIARDKNIQAALKQSLGDQHAKKLMTRINRESSMNANKNARLSGSRTTPLREEIDRWTEGEDDLPLVTEMVNSPTPVRNALLRTFQAIYNRSRRPGLHNPAINKAVADILYNRATRQGVEDLLEAMRNDPVARRAAILAARKEAAAMIDPLVPRQAGAVAGNQLEDDRRDVWIESSRDIPRR